MIQVGLFSAEYCRTVFLLEIVTAPFFFSAFFLDPKEWRRDFQAWEFLLAVGYHLPGLAVRHLCISPGGS